MEMEVVAPSAEGLFERGLGVVIEETRLGEDAPEIDAAEEEQVVHAVARRRIEFATGRACARRALSRLQIESFVLRNGPDRAPRWPRGVVGSITHTGSIPGGYCGVAVGRATELLALGLDAERAGAVGYSLWPQVLTAKERRWLDGQPEALQELFATIIFSAKECYYKAQFPLTGRWLDFGDVDIVLEPEGSAFEAYLASRSFAPAPLARCRGRYLRDQGFVLTGIAVPLPLDRQSAGHAFDQEP
jgi:4'-phosphopantetheinyl transferase EntD